MEDFTIKTRLTVKEYIKIMFIGLYKKPIYILTTLFGSYLLLTNFLNYIGILNYHSNTIFEIACGIFLIAAPSLITLLAVRQFTLNPSIQTDLMYTFGNKGIIIQGATFKSELAWAHIIKQKELGKFLVLYYTKKGGTFIDKTKLTASQLAFVKAKVNQN
jgi:hypothetical protein